MNLYQLYYFRTLAKLEHYTKAAAELSLTQPSLSHAMSALETELGVNLFEKQGRNIVLTKYGKSFLPYVENALTELEAGTKKLKELTSGTHGVISIGFIYTLSTHFIPSLIAGFSKDEQFKDIKFFLKEGTTQDHCTDELIKGLKDEIFDLIFVSLIPKDPNIDFIPICEQKLVAILPPTSPLAKNSTIDLKDLAPYPLIHYAGKVGLKREINRLFRKVNMVPKVSCEVENEISMAGLVAANMGVAVVPENPTFNNFNVKVVSISNPSYERIVYLGYMKNRQLILPVRQFKNYVINISSYKEKPI
ncbi:MAG: LysR family transcriptional regulator [Syntrophomonadaceae bacterium]|jgi:DNA-binding transcriptional LysR family regulator